LDDATSPDIIKENSGFFILPQTHNYGKLLLSLKWDAKILIEGSLSAPIFPLT
jgi:hypothetical protein